MDHAIYIEQCRQRWQGPAYQDACRNWSTFEELKRTLLKPLIEFTRDPAMRDLAGVRHNASETLTGMLWNLQANLQPDKSCLHPLLDFEEHYQSVFLRRGLIIYCSMLLREIEAGATAADGQGALNLQLGTLQ